MILIGLGSSLSFCGAAPQEVIAAAIRSIDAIFAVDKASRLFSSPAWPDPSDPPFVNAAISIRTGLDPGALLAALHNIEAAFGRKRGARNAPRTLDLDLLAYGAIIVDAGPMRLPHPALARRDFVLLPLCDIAPDWVDPRSGLTARELAAALPTSTAWPIN